MAPRCKPGGYRWEREGEILRCPWHGWEFAITTGRSIFDPFRMRVRAYDVTVKSPEEAEQWPSVESYPVIVERQLVVVHV